jgi:hypothetical protein
LQVRLYGLHWRIERVTGLPDCARNLVRYVCEILIEPSSLAKRREPISGSKGACWVGDQPQRYRGLPLRKRHSEATSAFNRKVDEIAEALIARRDFTGVPPARRRRRSMAIRTAEALDLLILFLVALPCSVFDLFPRLSLTRVMQPWTVRRKGSGR